MCATIPFLAGAENVIYSLLILAVSAFCLTSLDTATRLARYMFQEFWLNPGEDVASVTGFRAILVKPIVATLITVVLGIFLGMNGYANIWALFGAANQLLAALGLMAVATWLGQVGKNNKMFFIPMFFMLIVTICSLALTIKTNLGAVGAEGAGSWPLVRLVLAALLIILSLILAVKAVSTISGQKKKP